ncbi:MAG TPA: hypothetical protein DDY45_05145 [Verrucomicrobiales bacterium]|nr:hypothetical protein [Verrucomicrobiales bacterium]HBI31402.1 hypothetical protein [Verrucomicrobiales bacterium]
MSRRGPPPPRLSSRRPPPPRRSSRSPRFLNFFRLFDSAGSRAQAGPKFKPDKSRAPSFSGGCGVSLLIVCVRGEIEAHTQHLRKHPSPIFSQPRIAILFPVS